MLARTVEDAQEIASLLIAQPSQWSSLGDLPDRKQRELLDGLTTSTLHRMDLRGIRIGVPLDLIAFEDLPECKLEAFGRALFRMEAKGAKVNNKITIQGWREYEALSQEEKQIILDTDMKMAINHYLADLDTNPQGINDLQDLIDFTKECPGEGYPARSSRSGASTGDRCKR